LKYEGGTAYHWNQSFFTGGCVEVTIPLPSLSGTAGLRLQSGKDSLRRAGSGASLEGTVCIPVHHDGVPHNPDPKFSTVTIHLRDTVGTTPNKTRSGVSDVSGCPDGNHSLGEFSDLSLTDLALYLSRRGPPWTRA